MKSNKRGQIVLVALFKAFIFVILGIALLNIYPPFKDLVFASTSSLWIRLPVLALPVFYFVGIIFSLVNTIRTGAQG